MDKERFVDMKRFLIVFLLLVMSCQVRGVIGEDIKRVQICTFFTGINSMHSETCPEKLYNYAKKFALDLDDLRRAYEVNNDDIRTVLAHWEYAAALQYSLHDLCKGARRYIFRQNCKYCAVPYLLSKICCCGCGYTTDVYVKKLEKLILP